MNQLYGGQSKYVLLEVEVPPTVAARTREVASARCVYESAVDNTGCESRAQVAARFTGDHQEVVSSANKDVQADVSLNFNAELNNRVVDLADKGDTKQAVEELRKRSQQLKQEANQYYNSALQGQAVDLAEQAAALEKKGMDNTMRKSIRADSYQTFNQQLSK